MTEEKMVAAPIPERQQEPHFDIGDLNQCMWWAAWAKEEREWVEAKIGALNSKVKGLQYEQKIIEIKSYQAVCEKKGQDDKPRYTNETQRNGAVSLMLKEDASYTIFVDEKIRAQIEIYKSVAAIEGIKTGLKVIDMAIDVKKIQLRL